MTATGTPTIETLSSTPSWPPRRGVLTATALVLFAVIALIPSLLTPSPYTEAGVFAPAPSAAPSELMAPAQGGVSAGLSTVSGDRPAAYAMFCQNSPTLCRPTPPNPGYIQFCSNSPALCTVGKSDLTTG